jgi:hypothetical protein
MTPLTVRRATLPVMRNRSTGFHVGAAVCGHLVVAAAFLWLPWATGQGPLSGRGFSGPDLARLVRNLDVLLSPSAGVAAPLLALLLYLVPAAAAGGALLAATARWSSHPGAALRASTVAALLTAAVSIVTASLLLVGPAAGEALYRAPGVGLYISAAGAVIAIVAGRRASG